MARTRGIAASAEYSGDGVLLDKDGKPIPTTPATVSALHPHGGGMTSEPDPEAAEPSPPPAPPRYTCSPATLERSLEALDLARLLAIAVGWWEIEKTQDEWSRLPPDVKRHFRRVVE